VKLEFDGHQDYQLEAIQAIIDVFEGQPLAKSLFENVFKSEISSLYSSDKGIANQLVLTPESILNNIQTIQTKNGLTISKPNELEEKGEIPFNFSIEMETGTGKTYVYLRTIYELNKQYGFLKFVIVVPSIAIREGVIKNLQITLAHFQTLYNNIPVNAVMYDSKNHSVLRNFAVSNAIQILVINIDSFAKDSNIINTVRETGIKPIEYIQHSRPIVIIDEPQNMETPIRKSALANLNPLCSLRYSATHKNFYNLLYSLNPVQAYDKGLVKQIEIDAITSDNNNSAAFITFKKLMPGKRKLQAKVSIYVNDNNGVSAKDIILDIGDNLFQKSNGRESYKEGFILNSINAEQGTLEFSGGLILQEGENQGGLNDEALKFQIERTVENHFDRLIKLKPLGIKVLSLFFIDRVANYKDYSIDGEAQQGKFAQWFEAAFTKTAQKEKYQGLIPFAVHEVHNGYFSCEKKTVGKIKKELWIDSKEKNTKADEDTYSLIMKEKERLLSLDEPLQFIFSHSALREGWDNPNVFQICTLNETKSELKKRQEIGRGLRLPVNADGIRIQDKTINILTVIANESYEDFSKALQNEIESETSVNFEGRLKNKRDKAKIQLSKQLTLENYPLLFEIWEKIKQKTRYSVNYSTEELINKSAENLKHNLEQFPLKKPSLIAQKSSLKINQQGIDSNLKNTVRKNIDDIKYPVPDVYAYIQNRVNVSRNTVYEVLKQSGCYKELAINPQLFLDKVVIAIRNALNALLVDGIKYHKINGSFYEMSLFKDEEIETYISSLLKVSENKKDKTVFNYYPVDSDIERQFAREYEAEEAIKFFFKLPRGFKIPTPIGNYIPDWAILFDNDKKIYFVTETKSTLNEQERRVSENMKIAYAEKLFDNKVEEPVFDSDVIYKTAVKINDLY
jgi:type III restriction enzyme